MADNPLKKTQMCEALDLQNLVTGPTWLKNQKGSLNDLCFVSSALQKQLWTWTAGSVTGIISFYINTNVLRSSPKAWCDYVPLCQNVCWRLLHKWFISSARIAQLWWTLLSTHAFKNVQIVWMITRIFRPLWKRKPLGRTMYPIWIWMAENYGQKDA